MLKIYGQKQSRAARCMWAMEELGLQYEQVVMAPRSAEARHPDYLALNPSGKIPTLVHDGFVLTETFAINFYLASQFPGSLLPSDPRAVAKVLQWTSWALSDLEPVVVSILKEGRRPPEQIDAGRIEAARVEAQALVGAVLEPALAGGEYLLAGAGVGAAGFTLADLNVSTVASLLPMFQISLAAHPRTDAWLKRCLARPAYQRAQQKP